MAAGKNLSTKLLEYAVEQCKERNIKTLRLDCDSSIEKLNQIYQNFGFICEKKETLLIGGREYPTAFYVYYTNQMSVAKHYDALIDENNDPVKDPPILLDYMNKWDGQQFVEELTLDKNKNVLEVGVGTGRIALKICGSCKRFTGIDLSPKTIERAQENLKDFENINLICGDFLEYNFSEKFETIYSSLTFMHIDYDNKFKFIQKAYDLLDNYGRFVLAISKTKDSKIFFENRIIKIFPDIPNQTEEYILNAGFLLRNKVETEFAVIFICIKIK